MSKWNRRRFLRGTLKVLPCRALPLLDVFLNDSAPRSRTGRPYRCASEPGPGASV